MTWSFALPRRFLRGSSARLAFTVVALACGVALVCALDLVNRAVLRAFAEIIDTMAGAAALQVTVEDGGRFPESVAADVGVVPGVELAVPVVAATAFTADEPGESLAVHAFDVADDRTVRVYQTGGDDALVLEDALEFLNQPDSVVLTHEFARRRGLTQGDRITLDTSNGRRAFTVRALLEPHGIARAFGGNLVVMDLFAAEAAFTRPGLINRIDVVVRRDAEVAAVADAIGRVIPAGLRVETPAQRKADLQAVLRSLQALLQAIGLVALGAAFLIAFNRLTTMYEERAWQVGVLRALGTRRRVVWRELVKESMVFGLLGAAVGIPLGIGLGRLILPIIAMTTAINYRIVAPAAELSVRPMSLLLAVGLGVGAAVAAALAPAWRTSGVSVAETLRGRGVELPGRANGGAVWLARGVLAGGIVATVALQAATRDARWGLAATVLIVIATKVAAAPLLRGVGAPALRWLGEHVGPAGRLLTMSVMRNPRRSALTIAMVGIGLGTVVWLGFVAYSFEATVLRVFTLAMRADLVVSSSHIGGGALEMPVDDRFAATLHEVPGVRSVVGVRLNNWDYGGGPITLDAFDAPYFRNPEYGEWPLIGERLPDAWEAVARGEAVVASSNFLQNLGVRVGEDITLRTPNGPLRVTIAGATTDFASPRGTLEISRELYTRYWNDHTVTRFFVQAEPGVDHGTVRQAITAKLAAHGRAWRIISSAELVDYWGQQIRAAFSAVYVLGGVILGVILIGIADNLSAGIIERTRELGTLRALGVKRRRMGSMVIGEALVIAALGILLALAEGLAVGSLWVKATLPFLLGWVVMEFHTPVVLLIGTFFVSAVCCALAALIPGRKAARLEPAVALRWE